MAITNKEIIFNESLKFMESGILKGSGEFIKVKYEDGTENTIEFPEEIHTFAKWKELGYSVKKGEKSKIKFEIWKYTAKKQEIQNKDGSTDEIETGHFFLKMSAFFTAEQVEKIKG